VYHTKELPAVKEVQPAKSVRAEERADRPRTRRVVVVCILKVT